MTDTPPQTDPDTVGADLVTASQQPVTGALTGSAAPQHIEPPEAQEDAAYLDDNVPEGGDPYSNSEAPVEQEVDQ